MRITNYPNSCCYKKTSNKVTFSSGAREYKNTILDGCARKDVRTTTWMFRDLDWGSFAKLLDKNFCDKPKVNIYSLAAADGSEAYTCAIAIKECIPENRRKKFFPIRAYDIDDEILSAARSGRINLFPADRSTIAKFVESHDWKRYLTNTGLNKYFKDKAIPIFVENNTLVQNTYSYRVADSLFSKVDFQKFDVMDRVNGIKDNGNTVLLCRNIFPYLGEWRSVCLLDTIGEKLKKNSILVIGEFDYTNPNIDVFVEMAGFERVSRYVFRKKD